ncbi:MAG: efflux RND transporter periplasmic adaptor subunit [Sphingomonadales bacterium]
MKVSGDRIVISDVVVGRFDDFIPVRGRVTPLRTLYLDAVEGGRIERILVEDGAFVEAGDLLVELSNTTLQLDVISREAQVTGQLNNLRTIELALEQNRRAVTVESQETDARLQELQMRQLRDAGTQLVASLAVARQNLGNLKVRSPVSGKLTAFDAELGQSLSRGQRLGQIDDPNGYKLTAQIDEFYLGRVDLEQVASLSMGGKPFQLRVAKIYPQVNSGQFAVAAAQGFDLVAGRLAISKIHVEQHDVKGLAFHPLGDPLGTIGCHHRFEMALQQKPAGDKDILVVIDNQDSSGFFHPCNSIVCSVPVCTYSYIMCPNTYSIRPMAGHRDHYQAQVTVTGRGRKKGGSGPPFSVPSMKRCCAYLGGQAAS